MDDIYIVGVGMTPFGRFLDRSVKDLIAAAVRETLADVSGVSSRPWRELSGNEATIVRDDVGNRVARAA